MISKIEKQLREMDLTDRSTKNIAKVRKILKHPQVDKDLAKDIMMHLMSKKKKK